MRPFLFSAAAFLLLLTACKTAHPAPKDPVSAPANDTIILFVANHKAACPGPMLEECLLVKGEGEQEWRYFSDPINGFFHQDGFEYKIKVRKQKMPNPSPGQPLYYYRLITILEKKETLPDRRLHDIWVFESAKDKPALNRLPLEQKPTLEIILSENRFGGRGPCNEYSGQIESYGNFIRFGGLTSTLMACQNAGAESDYFALLRGSHDFKIENLRLILFKDGKEIMRFKKVD